VKGTTIPFQVTDLNSSVLTNSEMIVVRIPGLPGNPGCGSYFPLVIDEITRSFDEVILVRPDDEERAVTNNLGRTKAGPIITTNIHTKAGDCGGVYFGRLGTKWFARAVHYQYLDTGSLANSVSVGALVTRRDLSSASARLGAVFQGVYSLPNMYAKDGKVGFTTLPVKSELALAI